MCASVRNPCACCTAVRQRITGPKSAHATSVGCSPGRGRGCLRQCQTGTARGRAAAHSPLGLGAERQRGHKRQLRLQAVTAMAPTCTSSPWQAVPLCCIVAARLASSEQLTQHTRTCCRRRHQRPHSQPQVVEQADGVSKEGSAAHHLGQLRQQAAHVVALRQAQEGGRGMSGRQVPFSFSQVHEAISLNKPVTPLLSIRGCHTRVKCSRPTIQ